MLKNRVIGDITTNYTRGFICRDLVNRWKCYFSNFTAMGWWWLLFVVVLGCSNQKHFVPGTRRLVQSKQMTNMEMVSYWWSVVGFLAFVRGLLPTEAADALHRLLRSILDAYFLPYASFEIPEFEGPSINELYRNVQLHLTAKDLCRGARKTVLCKVKNSTNTTSTLAGNYL